jgi:hypothetical protein
VRGSSGSGRAWGFRAPISEYFFFDVAATTGLGPERAGVSCGIGLPIPTSNL